MITTELRDKILDPDNMQKITESLSNMGYSELMLIPPIYEKNKNCLNFVFKKRSVTYLSISSSYQSFQPACDPLADWSEQRTIGSCSYLSQNMVAKLYGKSTFAAIIWYGCEDAGHLYQGLRDIAIDFTVENRDKLMSLFDERLIPISKYGLEAYLNDGNRANTTCETISEADQQAVSNNCSL